MDFRPSFKKILNERMNTEVTSDLSSCEQDYSEPAHLSYLMGRISKIDLQLNRYKYPHIQRVRPPHTLNNQQETAFAFLKQWVSELSEAFTSSELRRAFRKAALRLHPDHGGNSSDFMLLKNHYKTLETVLRS